MKHIIGRIMEDPSGAFYQHYDRKLQSMNTFFSNLFMKYVVILRRIKVGKNCNFYGITYFRRFYKSSITIGTECRFRSSFLSNNGGLNRPCYISTLRNDSKIVIGDNVGMSGTVIGCAESITIGNNVLIGTNTFITDTDWHPFKRDSKEPAKTKPVVIEDDSFVGISVILLKGAHIGKGSVIGANSVVSGIIPPGVIAGGNPCKVIRPI